MNFVGSLPESLPQGLLVGKLLVGGLGVHGPRAPHEPAHRVPPQPDHVARAHEAEENIHNNDKRHNNDKTNNSTNTTFLLRLTTVLGRLLRPLIDGQSGLRDVFHDHVTVNLYRVGTRLEEGRLNFPEIEILITKHIYQ